MPITKERLYELDHNPSAAFTAEELAEGWHRCPEWDYLAVGPGVPEWDACHCTDVKGEGLGTTDR